MTDLRSFSFSGFIAGDEQKIAVGVSGGPDSMALCRALSYWAEQQGRLLDIHALTVNHNIRPEASDEAVSVANIVSDWPHVKATVLTAEEAALAPEDSALMEEARNLRYDLMAGYCREHDISKLYLAHHRDDQAETILFRLAKGSGLDGLGGMKSFYDYSESLTLIRPFLDIPKKHLVTFCEEEDIPFVRDPTNKKEEFARPRLRQARAVLEEEGLTSARLARTAKRLRRAAQALSFFTDQAYKDSLKEDRRETIVLGLALLDDQPVDIRVRVIEKIFTVFYDRYETGSSYGPGLKRIEALADEIFSDASFRKQTLGGLIIDRSRERNEIIFERE